MHIIFECLIPHILLNNFFYAGGFSMGGAMALHLAFKRFREVAGVFAISSFLNQGSAVYKVGYLI